MNEDNKELQDLKGENSLLKDKIRRIEDSFLHKESEIEKYEFVVNAYNESMTLINSDYVYEAVNDAYCRQQNMSREDIIGKTVADVWGKDIFESIIKHKLDQCLNGKILKEEAEFRFPDQKLKYYKVSYYPYKNRKGKVTHIVGVTEDITERKVAVNALLKSEQNLRVLNTEKDKYLRIINTDLKKASDYVISLLPKPIKNHGPLRADWRIIPSAQLGGDSFGYHYIDENNFAFYLLDVSGHGLGAALHSVSILHTLRFQNIPGVDFREPDQILNALNKSFHMAEHNELYFTLWYCVYNPVERKLKFAGGGHPPLLKVHSGGHSELIYSQNLIMGFKKREIIVHNTINIPEMTDIYLYSDGAYEVLDENKEVLSPEFVREYITENRNKDNSELDSLYKELKRLSGTAKLNDDFAILKITFV